ncbi:MAG TPA: DUF2341 domain-containing protein [Kofleriaceae bacterium]|jgi:hypothetical protein|nr:DUF2341 domain-containing protein [Kofleriaceae bacterium]
MRTACLLGLLGSACGFSPHDATGDAAPSGDGATMHDAAATIDGQDADLGSGSGSGSGSGGARRKPITILGAKVGGSLADFPVWIDLTDADIAARAQTNGADIFFTDNNGTALDRELASWSSTTHELRAWVRVPALGTQDTTIYVEYGDASKAPLPNPAGVFKSSFAAVWHLDDALSASSIADATGKLAATAVGLSPVDSVSAQLGKGINFDGTGASMITFANPLSGNAVHTISVWVDQPATTHTSTIFVIGTAGTDESRFLYSYAGNTNGTGIGVGQYSDDWYPATEDIEGTGWTQLVWTSEGSNKKNHLFRNGLEIPSSPMMLSSAANTTGSAGYLGFAPETAYGTSTGMLGMLDEVRIATVQRAPAWISTEYANQSSPSTFYSVGAEQLAP